MKQELAFKFGPGIGAESALISIGNEMRFLSAHKKPYERIDISITADEKMTTVMKITVVGSDPRAFQSVIDGLSSAAESTGGQKIDIARAQG